MRFTPVGFLPNGSGAMPAKPDKQKEEDKTMKNAKRMICIILGLCFIAMIGCNKAEKAEKDEAAAITDTGIDISAYINIEDEKDMETRVDVDVLYVGHCETLEELFEESPLIVRAKIVGKEDRLAGVRWRLDVLESSQKDVKQIGLVQLRDEHLLKEGYEVVLALVPDYEEGIYCIPGGGDGILFCTNGAKVNGDLLDSLLKKAGYTGTRTALTAESVYEMLVGIAG